MRLTHIKLSGFKSFVDPAHIAVPGQLVGVVGPNGCGKSNVIDAVRWVLGESSARHLRGETMQDVIFNGSGERKPVARASVELVFDNSLGKAAGQWAPYSEISVRRVLTRSGESSYYINNIHVRRRDVSDIFLGTGLGARAYAIIEQGMISRIVEAKPEELRVFLEEAAGVTKYRERRRETELRLEDTRENLQRVDDIRNELDKQLQRLETQAEVARQYRALEAELHVAQQTLWLLRKQEAEAQRSRHAKETERLGIELEAETASLRAAEKRLEELRAAHYAAGDALHGAQGDMYAANAAVAQLEQQIQFLRENRQRVDTRLTALRGQIEHGGKQRETAQATLDHWRQELVKASQQAEQCKQQVAQEAARLPLAEEAFRSAQSELAEAQRRLGETQHALQVEQTRREHAEKILQQLAARRERLQQEQAELRQPDEGNLMRLRDELARAERELNGQREALRENEAALPDLDQSLRGANEALEQASRRLTELEARRQALQQLQSRIGDSDKVQAWLGARQLGGKSHLWQGIRIEGGWEDALEAVLRERLNGIVVDDLGAAQSWLSDPPAGKLTLCQGGGAAAQQMVLAGCTPLCNYITCQDANLSAVIADWLHGVYVVEDRQAGLALRGQLPPGGMLVCREGHVFTRYSVGFYAPDSELHGVLARSREIEQLDGEVGSARTALAEQRAAREAAAGKVEARHAEIAALRSGSAGLQQRQHQLQMEVLKLTQQAERVMDRGAQIVRELHEIDGQVEAERAARLTAESNAGEFGAQIVRAQGELEQARQRHQESNTALGSQRQALQVAERAAQEADFHQRLCHNKIGELENTYRAIEQQLQSAQAELDGLLQEQAGFDEQDLQQRLQQALTTQSAKEQALAQARNTLEGAENELKLVEQQRMVLEQKLDPIRQRINDLRLKEQEARLTMEQFAQQLAEAGADEARLAVQLEKGVRANALQAEINRLNETIAALGAVNLAALEELQSSRERKTYLDAQSLDLNEARETLENAIKRIDRETRERLQQTFDEVNRHFSEMFPALFGGGQARLVMTGEEILDCGVQVIAQPPGKKNSSIHLLSGGEKALTALSLVFSIFHLNPAPFCLLDEVDAPLDDSNTERLCGLLKKMAQHTQFIFISHNKITMEAANQLIGITMQELGVSRVVSVDIEEAMRMREEALA
ncbi:MAG: chromosome segregation protein SMC [Pseudomonadota bacterium]